MQQHGVGWGGLGNDQNPSPQTHASTSAGWVLGDEETAAGKKQDICPGAEVKCRRLNLHILMQKENKNAVVVSILRHMEILK